MSFHYLENQWKKETESFWTASILAVVVIGQQNSFYLFDDTFVSTTSDEMISIDGVWEIVNSGLIGKRIRVIFLPKDIRLSHVEMSREELVERIKATSILFFVSCLFFFFLSYVERVDRAQHRDLSCLLVLSVLTCSVLIEQLRIWSRRDVVMVDGNLSS